MIAPTIVLCNECQHENESERVYCHNCGSRLDRALVKPKQEAPQDTQQRVKKMFDPRRAMIRAVSLKLSKLVLGAAALAAVVLAVLPAEVPAPPKSMVLGSEMRGKVEGMLAHNQPAQVDFTEEQVNAYLLTTLRTKKAALTWPLVEFNRAVLTFQERLANMTVQRSIYGYTVSASVGYEADAVGGKITPKVKSGHIGRLPIHPALMPYAKFLFADVLGVLQNDIKMLARCGGAEVHPQHLVLSPAAP